MMRENNVDQVMCLFILLIYYLRGR